MATDALYFNNETSGGNYFDLTGPALPNGDWAIGFWCRPDLMTNASAPYQYVISAGSPGTVGSMQIFIPSRQSGDEGCLYLRFYSDAGSAELNTVGCTAMALPEVGDGSDYLFIVQRRGSDLDYYVVKEGSATATPTTVASAAWGGGLNSRAWRIGGRTDAASLRWLSNPMGELFVIGQSLTAAQIVNLASGKHIDAVVATRLLDLRFRGNNAVESDLSGNGRNATRTGSNFSLVNEFFPDTVAASVTTPTISAPANGATGVSANPSFTASAFAGSGGLTHASSDWLLASDAGFTNIVASASADTTNRTTWSTTGLTAGTTYYARVRYRANDGTVSSYSATVSFTVLGTVTAPTISAPAAGATGISTSPTFTGSAFSATGGAGHESSNWQLATDSGFTNVVRSASADTVNKTSWPVTGLSASTTYYVRVQYKSDDAGISPYSAAISFTTAAPAATLNTPTIPSPANGSVGFKGALTLSGFSVSNGSDQHVSTTWQVSTSDTFSTLAASTTNDAVNKLSWTPSGLATGTTYYARALGTGATLGSSSWSPTISFTTIRTNTPTVSAPSENSTSPTITSSAFSSTGVDQHVSTSWQAATNASFTTGLIDNANDVANLTSWVPFLAASTTYYLRCRHVGQAGGVSAWSATVTYTTGDVVTEALPSAIATTGTRALFPYAITDTVLKSSSIAETDYAAWDPVTNYALGVKCIRVATHSVYQRITPGVSATPPESDPVNWVKVGPTNRWGMFDGAVGTVSSATTSFEVTLTLGPVNDAAFLNVTGSSIQIQLPSGTTVTKSVPASPVAGVGSTVLFQSLGGTAGDYRITVTGTGTVSVGNLSLGNFVSVGSPKYGVNLGYTDYSVREIDAFGSLKLVPRPAQDRMDVQLEIPKASANQVAYVLAALRAKPCVWLGVPDYDTTVIFGTIKSQSVRFSNKSYVDGQIQINALTLG